MKKKPVIIGLSALCLLGLSTYPVIKNAELARQKEEQAAVRRNVLEQEQQRSQELQTIQEEVEGYFYYQQLSREEQRDYVLLTQSLREFKASSIPGKPNDTHLAKVYLAIAYDQPEFYWLSEQRYQVDFTSHVYPDDAKEVQAQLHALADEVIAQMPDGSDYDKVKYIYEYIIHNTQYNTAALTDDNIAWQNQSIRSVFIDKLSICNGYALAFNFLCQKAGIESIYVAGDISDSEYGHAWNLVKIDGQYYTVDTTWGDPVFSEEVAGQDSSGTIDYSYLCMPPVIFNQTHFAYQSLLSFVPDYKSVDTFFNYPLLTATDLSYHALNNNYFATYDLGIVSNHLLAAFRTNPDDEVSLQIGDKAGAEAFLATLESEQSPLHYSLEHLPNYKGYQFKVDPSSQVFVLTMMK